MKKIIPTPSTRYEVWVSCQRFNDPKPLNPLMKLSCAWSDAQMALSFMEEQEARGYVVEVIDTKDGSLVKASRDLEVFERAVIGLC